MNNRDKIELLRKLHGAINDQLCETIDNGVDHRPYENMPMYTIGVGTTVFTFPATVIYRVMFDCLFQGWDSLKDDSLSGVESSSIGITDVADDPRLAELLGELFNNDDEEK